MKKSFFEVLTLVVVLAVTGCRQAGAPEALPVIDLSKDYPEKEFVAQDLFDVEYVPLETNDEFLVGGFVLAVSGHYIVTVDPMHEVGSIILFDRRTGKGLLKMNQLGKGPEDYSCVDDVIPDDANDEHRLHGQSRKCITVLVTNTETPGSRRSRSTKEATPTKYSRMPLILMIT